MSTKPKPAAQPVDCPHCKHRAWLTVALGNYFVCCLTTGCPGQDIAGVAIRKHNAVNGWNRNVMKAKEPKP